MANTDKNKVLDLEGLDRYDELIKQLIEKHTGSKDNPHEVTKEQIGLSSVENKSVAEILAAMTSEDVTKALGFTPQRQGAGGGGGSYGFASETEAGVIMSGGDISVDENGVVTVNSMSNINVGSDVQPIYFKDGKPEVGYYTLAAAAGKGVTNITATGNLGWVNTSTGGLFVPSLNTLAFWNGEYAEGMSNIEYFKLGKFGSMATRNEDDFLATDAIADWAKAISKPEYTYTEVGADKAGSADTALASAKEYALNTINTKIAELINSAPETMDTLGELATLMTSNQEAVDILNEAIAKRATTSDLTTHTGNTSNPHGVTKAQVGLDKVDNTADADKIVKHAATADALTTVEATTDTYRNVWFAHTDNPSKLVYNPAFQYNPSTDTLKVGNITGRANSADTADALAVTAAIGSALNPVYIDATGKPVKTTYTLGASVPAGAKFTDTTYTLESFGLTATAEELNILDGVTVNAAKINYLTDVTSNIQAQLNGKAPTSHGTHVTFGTTVPLVAGTAAVGSASTVSRSDHVHPAQTTISGNAGSATKLQTARTIDGVSFNGSAAITHYGTCSTAAATAAKTVALTGFSLVTGSMVFVKFTVTNTAANPTLNVNSTGAKAIMYRGSAISASNLAANRVYAFLYDGTDWEFVGDIDTDTTYGDATTSAAGLMSAADKAKLDATNIAYGTCATSGSTPAKEITLSGNENWKLAVGSKISVKFTSTNTAANPTFNVNGTGAISIQYNNSTITTGNLNKAGYSSRILTYVYDGTYYQFVGWSYDTDTNTTYTNASLGNGYGTCSTEEATTEKAVVLANYSLKSNGMVAVKFTYAVPADATMSINSATAKPIYYQDAPITAGIINAGDLATFIYTGSYYRLLAIDSGGSGGTFTGGTVTRNVQQSGATTDYTTYKFRNIAIGSTTTPTSNATYGVSGAIYIYCP